MDSSLNKSQRIVETNSYVSSNLNLFDNLSKEEILNQRKNKFLKIGRDKGFISNPEAISDLNQPINKFDTYLKLFKKNKIKIFSGLAFILTLFYIIL